MLTLFCAVAGQKGSAFPVKIDESESIGDLKDAIKQRIICFDVFYFKINNSRKYS
jgi:Crinkler effector protein N-terminal domain